MLVSSLIFVGMQGVPPFLHQGKYSSVNDSVLECTEISEEKIGLFFNFNKIHSDTGLLLFSSLFSKNRTKPKVELICLKDVVLTSRFGKKYAINADFYPNLENTSIEMKRIESIADRSFPKDVKVISIWAPKLQTLPIELGSKTNLESFYLETKAPFCLEIIKSSWKEITSLSINLNLDNQTQILELDKLEFLELFNTRLDMDFVIGLMDIKSLRKLVLYANFTANEKQIILAKLPFEVEFKSFSK